MKMVITDAYPTLRHVAACDLDHIEITATSSDMSGVLVYGTSNTSRFICEILAAPVSVIATRISLANIPSN